MTRLESLACPIFAQDCEDPNPLIRALAVRTMGCIRVDKITEYLCEPLRKCLKDEDPYVRKTAAVCVAKLYDINAALVEDQGFLDQLKDLLSDSNPMVCINFFGGLINFKHWLVVHIKSSTKSAFMYLSKICKILFYRMSYVLENNKEADKN